MGSERQLIRPSDIKIAAGEFLPILLPLLQSQRDLPQSDVGMRNERVPLQAGTKEVVFAFRGTRKSKMTAEGKIYILKSTVHIINHDIPHTQLCLKLYIGCKSI